MVFTFDYLSDQRQATLSMADVKSCGFLVYRVDPQPKSFLLMEHATRWDIPKGHVDPGETELECALRELHEETGIVPNQIVVDEHFRFVAEYKVTVARYGRVPKLKELVIYLARLVDPQAEIRCTEHLGYRWFDWNPPHRIQVKTIDPLLAHLNRYWAKTDNS
jgi:8-oxo-dGTP pyrophosphatase MutT (NUDIX family)